MSEMIERVAEAIHNSWQNSGAGPQNRFWSETCEKLPAQADSFRRYAVLAIKAMREPTDEMLKKVYELRATGDDFMHRSVYQKMIDAIIGDET